MIIKTLVLSKTNEKRVLSWCNKVLMPRQAVVLDGLYPECISVQALKKDLELELKSGRYELYYFSDVQVLPLAALTSIMDANSIVAAAIPTRTVAAPMAMPDVSQHPVMVDVKNGTISNPRTLPHMTASKPDIRPPSPAQSGVNVWNAATPPDAREPYVVGGAQTRDTRAPIDITSGQQLPPTAARQILVEQRGHAFADNALAQLPPAPPASAAKPRQYGAPAAPVPVAKPAAAEPLAAFGKELSGVINGTASKLSPAPRAKRVVKTKVNT